MWEPTLNMIEALAPIIVLLAGVWLIFWLLDRL